MNEIKLESWPQRAPFGRTPSKGQKDLPQTSTSGQGVEHSQVSTAGSKIEGGRSRKRGKAWDYTRLGLGWGGGEGKKNKGDQSKTSQTRNRGVGPTKETSANLVATHSRFV